MIDCSHVLSNLDVSPVRSNDSCRASLRHSNGTHSEQCNVSVMVRVRPFMPRERALPEPNVLLSSSYSGNSATPRDTLRSTPRVTPRVTPRESSNSSSSLNDGVSVIFMDDSDRRVVLLDPARNYREKEAYEFDRTFWSIPKEQNQFTTKREVADQDTVYQCSGKTALQAALSSYNVTLFAYGQTGSGKTHTMFGTPSDPGITIRLLKDLFTELQERSHQSQVSSPSKRRHKYSSIVELSFFEIYNEKVKDLLAKPTEMHSSVVGSGFKECKVRFHPSRGAFAQGLRLEEVHSAQECLALIQSGMQHRHVAETKLNEASSRSHVIVQLQVKERDALEGKLKTSQINLVDLAGSERVKNSGVEGNQLTEARNINLSLSTLRRVIDVLIENKGNKSKTIPPYRESLLTWLLSDALGGNSRTLMVATISPSILHLEDTANTLRYAHKAKSVVCTVHINEKQTAVVVSALQEEMVHLKRKLAEDVSTSTREAIQDELSRLDDELEKAIDEHRELERQGEELRSELQRMQLLLERQQQLLREKQQMAEDILQLEKQRQKALEQFSDYKTAYRQERRLQWEKAREINDAMDRITSFKRKHNRYEESLRKMHDKQRSVNQRSFADVFRSAVRIAREKKEIALLSHKLTRARHECQRIEERHRSVTAEHQAVTAASGDLRNRWREFEMRLEVENKKLDDFLTHNRQETLAYQEEIQKYRCEREKILPQIEALHMEVHTLEYRTNPYMIEYHACLLEEQQALSDLKEMGEECLILSDDIETLRVKLSHAEQTHALTSKAHERLLSESQNLQSLEERYEQRLGELLSEISFREKHVHNLDTSLEQAQAHMKELKQKIQRTIRNHRSLKGFVSKKCLTPRH